MTIPADLDRRTLRPAAFLSREGVVTQCDTSTTSLEHIRWIPNVVTAIRRLNDAGYLVFVVTNELGVARGDLRQEDMERLHLRLRLELRAQGARIDDWRYCPYHPDATVPAYRRDSDWRKPRPGMIFDLMRFWPVELDRSFVIGREPTDLEAAQAAGIRGYLFVEGDLPALVESALTP